MQAFEIIPVVDLKNQTCVYAVGGERANYRPIKSLLAPGTSDPAAVAAALVKTTNAATLYVADLDAISQTGANDHALHEIATAVPKTNLWIDPGIRTIEHCRHRLRDRNHSLVIASETLQTTASLSALTTEYQNRTILSLDFDDKGFRGDGTILDHPGTWPNRVIVMTLSQVGRNQGPDLKTLTKIKQLAPDKLIYAAGGLRDLDDAMALKTAGFSGVLVASALHKGVISQKEIAALR